LELVKHYSGEIIVLCFTSDPYSFDTDPIGIPVPVPIRIQGFFPGFFLSKTTIYLSLDLHKGRPRYKRSLQLSKENIQYFKT
jgi:hypothetical protein